MGHFCHVLCGFSRIQGHISYKLESSTYKGQGPQEVAELPAEASVQGKLQSRPKLSLSAFQRPGGLRILLHRAFEGSKLGVLLRQVFSL